MAPWDLVASPITIMAAALAIGCAIYWWSRSVAPASVPSVNKSMPYIGGEIAEAQVWQPGYQFFYVALFFTVVHVAALIIATAPPDAPLAATLGYLAIMAFGVAILRWEQ